MSDLVSTRSNFSSGPARVVVVLMLGLAVLGGAMLFALSVGPTDVDLARAWNDGASADHAKVFGLRLPRSIAAAVSGAALALAGLVFQSLLKNPLASPYVLGVSAGGAFGAVTALSAGWWLVRPCAFTGAMVALLLVMGAARAGGGGNTALLLAGVVVNALFGAGVLFVNVVAEPRNQERILRWMVGGFDGQYAPMELLLSACGVVLVLLLLLLRARELDLLALGEHLAAEAGVDVARMRLQLLLLATLLAALAVVLAGPIGFVGLLVPHALRLCFGAEHRLLVPAALGFGGAFLVLVDACSQVLLAVPLPAGVLTAVLGGPLFLLLLARGGRSKALLDG